MRLLLPILFAITACQDGGTYVDVTVNGSLSDVARVHLDLTLAGRSAEAEIASLTSLPATTKLKIASGAGELTLRATAYDAAGAAVAEGSTQVQVTRGATVAANIDLTAIGTDLSPLPDLSPTLDLSPGPDLAGANVPDSPTAVAAVADQPLGATVAWAVPASNHGSTILTYTVTSSPDGVTKTVSGAATTSAVITGLSVGPHTFTVRATNGVGPSVASAPSNTVPIGDLPAAPTDVTATALAGNEATVTWTAASDPGHPITGFTVTASTGGITLTAPAGASSVRVSGLAGGQSYTFRVTATNDLGTGATSAPSNAIVAGDLPSAPVIGVATAAAQNKATVTWTATSAANHPITHFTITASTGGITAAAPAGATSAQVSGLTAGQSYTFRVTASNDLGSSAPSEASNAIVVGDVPGAPTIGSATATPGNRATVTWTAPASDGNHPILGFTVTSQPGGLTASAVPGATSAQVSGLTANVSYTFTVASYNDLGTSAPSAPSNAVTAGDVPAAPTIGAATANAGHRATVTWTPPATGPGISPVDGYTVTSSPGGLTATAAFGATSAQVSGLGAGVSYTFRVTAYNGFGTSAPSAASNAVVGGDVPGAPTIGGTTADPGNRATVSWTAPAAIPGHPIQSYTVLSTPGGLTAAASAGATSVQVSGLSSGVSYTFTVTAANDLGSSAASAASNAVVGGDVPAAPTGVSATAIAGRAAHVAWTPPAPIPGYPLTGYTITPSSGTPITVSSSATSAMVSGLTIGTAYTFTITARNDLGNGASSSPTNSIWAGDIPPPPTTITAIKLSANRARVSWTPPAWSDTHHPITKYVIKSAPSALTKDSVPAARTDIIGSLTDGQAYTFTVAVHNDLGSNESSPSNSITATAGIVDTLFVLTLADILIFEEMTTTTATGSQGGEFATPTRRIAGSNTHLAPQTAGLFVDAVNRTMYVSGNDSGQIAVWNNAHTVNGNQSPDRTITLPSFAMGGVYYDRTHDRLYAQGNSKVYAFNSGSTISGAPVPAAQVFTSYGYAAQVFVDEARDHLYVGDHPSFGGNQTLVFHNASTMTNNGIPDRILVWNDAAQSFDNSVQSIWVDSARNLLYSGQASAGLFEPPVYQQKSFVARLPSASQASGSFPPNILNAVTLPMSLVADTPMVQVANDVLVAPSFDIIGVDVWYQASTKNEAPQDRRFVLSDGVLGVFYVP